MNSVLDINPNGSCQEILLTNKINQAILDDQDVNTVAKNFLDVIDPVFNIKSSRVYSFDNETKKLTLLAENFEENRLKIIQDTIGVKIKHIIPDFSNNNYLYLLAQQKKPTITSNSFEIRSIVAAHTDSKILKKFVDWAIKIFNLRTFGIIPLHIGEKLVGLITFASTKKFTREEKDLFIRCTDHVSIGIAKKIVDEKLKTNRQLQLLSEEMGKIGSWEVELNDPDDWSKNPAVWSDESYRIFGYQPNSVSVSYPFFLEHVHPDDKYLVSGNLEHLFVPGFQHEIEYRILLKNGTIKHILGRFYVIFDKDRKPLKLVGMSQDITDRKKMELELADHNKKLKKEVELQTLELSIANKNLEAFNYSISHDLRVPLRGIEMFSDLLLEELENDLVKSVYIKGIKDGLDEMKSMIGSLLEFAKYGEIELHKEKLDMATEINACIHLLTGPANYSNIEFHIKDCPALFADKTLMRNIILNLISNAIKYSSKKKQQIIEIKGQIEGDYTTYSISDNGDGFDNQKASKLFKPFSRLHNQSEFDGNGVGLAIVERIIARHGGQIWAEGIKGTGATFYFKIPNP